jgi:ADP-heptose:LPS heptosyltransferase
VAIVSTEDKGRSVEGVTPVVGPKARILVVKLADIGDAVLSLPAIQAIRSSRHDAVIDVLTTEAGANVFGLSNAVNDVITIDKQRFDHVQGLISVRGMSELLQLTLRLRRGHYDVVVLLHHLTTSFGTRKFRALARAAGAPVIAGLDNGRGSFLTHSATDFGFGTEPEWQYGLNVVAELGLDPTLSRPQLVIPDSDIQSAQDQLRQHSIDSEYVVLHPEVGDFSPARAWPLDHFTTVAHGLAVDTKETVVLVGVDRNRRGLEQVRRIPGVVDLTGKTTFPELCAIVKGASLVIGGDSAVSHLAGAFDRPLISLFGPSNIDAWKPYGAEVRVAHGCSLISAGRSVALHLDMPCSPCIYSGFRLGRPQGCRSRTCLAALSPGQVLLVARGILDSHGLASDPAPQ